MLNKLLNTEKVAVESTEQFVNRLKSIDKLGEMNTLADKQEWTQFVALTAAQAPLPDDFENFEKLFNPLEVEIRKAMGIVSKRGGGTRSKGTGCVLHPTIKSYKSTVKGAYEYGVELLDAAGVPRSRDDISSDIKDKKPIKDPEEKLMGAVELLFKLWDSSSDADPRTIDAKNFLINSLGTRGYTLVVETEEAA